MPFRIAAASSDRVHIDLHFGNADRFYIYEVHSDGSYELVSIASVPRNEESGNQELVRVSQGSSGCGAGGCGGCHTTAALSLNTDFLEGSKYVLAAKIGKRVEKALLQKNITAFSIELPIEQAIRKIVVYENRLNQFR